MRNRDNHRNEIAIESIIAEFQDQLFRYAFFRLGSLVEAQDVVQDVFVRLFQAGNRPSGITNLKGYLFRSVYNSCCDRVRKKNRNRFAPLDTVMNTRAPEDGNETNEWTEEYERIEKRMAEIPEEQTEVIRLKTLNDLSFVEIAAILDLPVTTVKSRFKYGIDKLRTRIN